MQELTKKSIPALFRAGIDFLLVPELIFLPKEFTHWLFSPELTSVHRYIGKIDLQISKRRQLVRVLCPVVPGCGRLCPVGQNPEPPRTPPGRKPHAPKTGNKHVFGPPGPSPDRRRHKKFGLKNILRQKK